MAKNRISLLRKESGLNQRELGLKLGVGQTTVSAWETGKNEPDSESMHKMAQLFHCSIGYLAGYEHNHRTKGLTREQLDELFEKLESERQAEALERLLELEEQNITPAELEAMEAEDLYRQWQQSAPEMYFELYQISLLFEYLTEDQRKRALSVIEMMFPYAVNGKYTDEIPH